MCTAHWRTSCENWFNFFVTHPLRVLSRQKTQAGTRHTEQQARRKPATRARSLSDQRFGAVLHACDTTPSRSRPAPSPSRRTQKRRTPPDPKVLAPTRPTAPKARYIYDQHERQQDHNAPAEGSDPPFVRIQKQGAHGSDGGWSVRTGGRWEPRFCMNTASDQRLPSGPPLLQTAPKLLTSHRGPERLFSDESHRLRAVGIFYIEKPPLLGALSCPPICPKHQCQPMSMY